MKVEHRLQVTCTCPVDGTIDIYDLLVEADRTIPVEAILGITAELATGPPRYQEDLTGEIARQLLGTLVTSVGVHSGVETTVVCGEE